jgi:DNA primase
MISPSTIDEIRSRMDIVEVISDYVQLKRAGANYKALSPFTQERTPSFVVSPAKQIFKCFSTGKGGDSISFVMEIDGLSYVEALRYLAKKYNVEINEEVVSDEEQEKFNERESLFILLNFAKDYYKNLLWDDDEGKAIGLSYFKERGFSEETIKEFDLGYSLDKWDGLIVEAKKQNFNEALLEKAGLKIVKENKEYDRFRGRVIFPIHNVSGKTIAFGARILKNAENQPKYINSPETDLYTKSKVLYGISQAKQAIRADDLCYLVEGYTDVVSLHQWGIKNVVASSGTSLTEEQIKLIYRYTKNVTILFDGDAAGIKASMRGIDMLLQGNLNVRAVRFPQGEDPDSYARKLSPTAYKEFLSKESSDFIVFKTSVLMNDVKSDPGKKADTIREIVASIAKIPDPIKREVYIKECGVLLGIDEGVLITEQNKILLAEGKKASAPKLQVENPEDALLESIEAEIEISSTFDTALTIQERECIRMLLNYADFQIGENAEDDLKFITYFVNEFEDVAFENPVYKNIFDIFNKHLEEGVIINAQHFIHNEDEKVKNAVIDIIAEKHSLSENWEAKFNIFVARETDELKKSAFQSIIRLKFRIIRKMIQNNMDKLKEATSDEEVSAILESHQQLKGLEVVIAKEIGNVAAY